jgi:hypothetical protein
MGSSASELDEPSPSVPQKLTLPPSVPQQATYKQKVLLLAEILEWTSPLITLVADYTRSQIIIAGTDWVLLHDEMDNCPFESYNIETGTWNTYYGLSPTFSGDRICFINDYVYNISSGGNRKTNLMESNPTWTSFPMIPNKPLPWGSAICVYNNCIYLFGGQIHPSQIQHGKGIEYFSSVYMFNPQTLLWEFIGEMSFPRGQPAVCTCNDMIIISGGSPNLNSCEIFDPKTRIFSAFPPLNENRYAHSMTSWKNYIFTFGTHDFSYTYEKLDMNVDKKKWVTVPFGENPTVAKFGIQTSALRLTGWTAVTVEDFIYILGMESCYQLDPVTLKMKKIAPMSYKRGGYGSFGVCVGVGE